MNSKDDSIADVLKNAVRDAQDLVRGEIALARAEFREEVRRVGAGVAALAAAAVAALIAVVFLLTAAAWGISTGLGWPSWAGFAVVGGVVTLVALVLAYVGRRRVSGERHMRRTVDTLKENMEWMRSRTS
jgi:uncharacterized membrane protein